MEPGLQRVPSFCRHKVCTTAATSGRHASYGLAVGDDKAAVHVVGGGGDADLWCHASFQNMCDAKCIQLPNVSVRRRRRLYTNM
jgi:hypothetical protein